MKLLFTVPDAHQSVLAALRTSTQGVVFFPCPLDVGDTMSFPDAPTIFYTIKSRIFVSQRPPQESEWVIALEPCANPFALQP